MTAMLSFGVPTISGVTVVWDQATANQPLTLIKEVDSGSTQARAELWGLVAPASGAHTLTVSWMTFSDIYLDVCSWTGVDQTGGTTSFPGSTSVMGSLAGTSTIPITVTSAVGDYVLAVYSMAGSGVTSVDQTPVPGYGASGFDNTGSGCCNAAANQATGAASVTLTANYATTFFAVGAATNIKAAGSAPTSAPLMQLLGVGP
jgi:hypothetical protein